MPLYSLENVSPQLPDGPYYVAPTAVIIGDVRLDTDSSIWFGTVLRGDNDLIHIGARSNVQDNCVLHTDFGYPLTIAPDCTIGHMVTLHGCTIGENTLIGMGATILNGAKIGKNCIVGANALVPEGKEIPDNSLAVGSPARIVRTLDEAQIAMLRGAAEIYVKNAQRFRDGLQELPAE
ncbi:MAG: gamma carbonic anhydrase family protein [Rhizobiales bacterium]|nr:gamma carbonic anhydrase family protein [Hyphomicrobiales bacterium]